jgi:hypothetical protein
MYPIETHIASQLHYKMPLFISVPCSKHSDPLDLNYLATSQPPPGVIQRKHVLQADSKLPNSSIKYHGLHSHRQGEGSRPNCGGKISHCEMGTLSHLSIIVHHQPLILKHPVDQKWRELIGCMVLEKLPQCSKCLELQCSTTRSTLPVHLSCMKLFGCWAHVSTIKGLQKDSILEE